MFVQAKIETSDKPTFYQQLRTQLTHLVAGETNAIANLSNTSALLNDALYDINWVGFYLWSESENTLILGPFQGKPACIRIAEGKGVCGTAVKLKTTQVVADVQAFPGHIACDSASNSEIVVPIVKDGLLIGVLDIDSPSFNRFDEADAQGLEKIVDVLRDACSF